MKKFLFVLLAIALFCFAAMPVFASMEKGDINAELAEMRNASNHATAVRPPEDQPEVTLGACFFSGF